MSRLSLLFVMCFFVCFLFFLSFTVSNSLVWWSVFVVMDLVFIFVCKSDSSYGCVVNYFVYQECLGLIFLFLGGSALQGLVVVSKMGLLPLHYWVSSVIGGLGSWSLYWFLTWQKLPYMPILFVVIGSWFVGLLLLGFVLGWWQLFVVDDYGLMLLLGSAESFNWMLVGYLFCFWDGGVLFVYYFFCGLMLLPFFSSEYDLNYGWLTVMVYVNIPLGVSFFVKVFVLGVAVGGLFVWLLCLLLLMYISFWSVFSWFVFMSMKLVLSEVKSVGYVYLVLSIFYLLLV